MLIVEFATTVALATTLATTPMLGVPPVGPTTVLGLTSKGRLFACPVASDCVSSAAREAPNRAVAPLAYPPSLSRDAAYRAALDALGTRPDTAVRRADAAERYIWAEVGLGNDATTVDDLELLVLPGGGRRSGDDEAAVGGGGVVAVREVARVKGPTPPFCVKPGCINANGRQRERVRALGAALGWSSSDATEMEDDARWTPIFFNDDRVPWTTDSAES